MLPLEIKALVRQRDGYRCVECGMTQQDNLERFGRQLDVHRRVPGSPYSIDGCETLCRDCHAGKPKSSPSMVRAGKQTLRVPRHLCEALDRLIAAQLFPPSRGRVIAHAVAWFLAQRGFLEEQDMR